jgi:CYTH domain-containing protein/predicted ATPase
MVLEIERRYLLRAERYSFLDGVDRKTIQQGYFPTLPGTSLRVRIVDDERAFITHKLGDGLTREETEVPIGIDAARSLLACCPYRINKTRYMPGRFEIDFLEGPLSGIVLAEIELKNADEAFEKPEWLEDAVDVTESVNNLALAKLASKLGDKKPSKELHEILRPPLPLIALTGGPCSGKTTAISKLKNELGEKIRVVPEAARFLIEELGMRPDPNDPIAYANFQEKLYLTQRTLEEAALDDAWSQSQKAVIADRGTLDTLAYLKGGVKEFERLTGARVDHELARYTRVIHLATAPETHYRKDDARHESYEDACKLGDLVQLAWKGHRHLRLARLENWDHKMAQVIGYVLEAIPD